MPVCWEPCTMTMGTPFFAAGTRKCTYIWFTMMFPGGVGPVTSDAPGYSERTLWPFTKNAPSSSSVSGPPSVAAPAATQKTDIEKANMRASCFISPPSDSSPHHCVTASPGLLGNDSEYVHDLRDRPRIAERAKPLAEHLLDLAAVVELGKPGVHREAEIGVAARQHDAVGLVG